MLFAAVSMAIVAVSRRRISVGRYGGLYGTAFSGVAALLGPLGGSWLLGHGTWLPWLTCAFCAPRRVRAPSRSHPRYDGGGPKP